jgi:CubicO group peptidase (beta-lactamase class C family)
MPLSLEIDALLGGAIERRVFPGAVVLIAQGDVIRHYKAYGATMYDAPTSRPVERTTIYDIASLTKMFTATAALRLYDQRRLDLAAPVAAYLPAFRQSDISIRHLLTHTSGLDIRLSALRHAGRAGLLEAVYQAETTYQPGARVAYTNVNSLLLGEIVARLCDAPLDVAIQDLVIAPLGLRDTWFCPPAELLPRIAPTEVDMDWRGALVHGSVHDESAHTLGGVAGHAGLFSTAEDLYKFCRAWLTASDGGANDDDWRLLDPQTIALATTDHSAGLNVASGLGWMLDRSYFMGAAPPGTYGHTGFTGPAIAIIPRQELMVIQLSNRVYPRRGPATQHSVTAAIVEAAMRAVAE